jgi:uncharacterized protein YceK
MKFAVAILVVLIMGGCASSMFQSDSDKYKNTNTFQSKVKMR